MSIVYDIVQIVEPGARCSYRPGRWQVDHRDSEGEANRTAALFNNCVRIEGVRYVIERHDEESRERADVA